MKEEIILLKEVLELFDDEVSKYIAEIKYNDSPTDFEIILERDDEDYYYQRMGVWLYDDGSTATQVYKTDEGILDYIVLDDHLVNACNKIIDSWKEFVKEKSEYEL